MNITTAQLTVTAEDLAGLTCSECSDPATHTVDLVMGTVDDQAAIVKRYVCQVDATLAIAKIAGELSPNWWPHYGDTIAAVRDRGRLRTAETVESRQLGHGSAL